MLEDFFTWTRKTLVEFLKQHKLGNINYFVPTPDCRVDNPLIGGTSFFTRASKDGITFPIHPFFYDVLNRAQSINLSGFVSYGWHGDALGDLYQKTPSVNI